jgi:hypothetical protein
MVLTEIEPIGRNSLLSKRKLFSWKNKETFKHFIWEDIAAVLYMLIILGKNKKETYLDSDQ